MEGDVTTWLLVISGFVGSERRGIKMWLKFKGKRDYSMANHGTQEIPSPVKLVSMKFFDAREMRGGR